MSQRNLGKGNKSKKKSNPITTPASCATSAREIEYSPNLRDRPTFLSTKRTKNPKILPSKTRRTKDPYTTPVTTDKNAPNNMTIPKIGVSRPLKESNP